MTDRTGKEGLKAMKKIVALIAAVVFCFALTATAFASTSVSVNGLVEAASAKDADGNDVTIVASNNVDDSTVSAVKAMNLKTVCGDNYDEALAVIDILELTCSGTNVTVTLEVPEAKAGMIGGVIHLDGSNEYIPATVADGTMTFVAPSFSAYAIVLGASATNPSTNDVVSFAPYAILAAAAVVCGVVVFRKKA